MEQPKRISLNSSVSWFKENEDVSTSMDDHWDDDLLLGNESLFVLEGEQTCIFSPSLMNASRADVSDDEDSACYSDNGDSIPTWNDGVFYHNNELQQSADPRQLKACTSWEECRRKLELSMERSKKSRSWIESNIIQLCHPNTQKAIYKTLQSTALMETILKQTPERCPWFIIEDESSSITTLERCRHHAE